jgi:ATP synthase F1 delta subunit
MMGSSLVAKRYARALFNTTEGRLDQAKSYRKVLVEIGKLFEETKFKKVLNSPVIPKDLKKEVLKYILDCENADKNMRSFVENVIDARRIQIFPGLLDAFVQLLNEVEGIVEANFTSVVHLGEKELISLKETLCRMTGKSVSLREIIDPKILGGFVVRIGNSVVDLSLKSKLEATVRNASW